MNVGPGRGQRRPGRQPPRRRPTCVIDVGTRLRDFVTGSQDAVREPGRRFVGINVKGFDAHKLGARPLIARREAGARGAHRSRLRRRTTPAPTQAYRDAGRATLKAEWDAAAWTSTGRLKAQTRRDLAQPEVIGIAERRRSAATRPSSARRAARRATCSSCGDPRTARPTTWSTATRAWATRSRPASASRWPSPSAARSSS